MIPEELERFRICLLQQLRAVGDGSLPLATIVTGLRIAGFENAAENLARASLAYLQDKGFVASIEKPLSPENKRWRITAAGVDFLAVTGL